MVHRRRPKQHFRVVRTKRGKRRVLVNFGIKGLNKVRSKLKSLGFKTSKVDATPNYFRFRQESPSKFRKGTLRTKDIGKKGGLKIIVGRPLGRKKTKVQSVLVER